MGVSNSSFLCCNSFFLESVLFICFSKGIFLFHQSHQIYWHKVICKLSLFFFNVCKRLKRQATDWENIFAIHVSDKELLSRTCKELFELNNKRTIQFKNGKIFQRCFIKEDLHVKPMKSCLTLVDIRDMQIKVVMGCHYPSVRMVRIFKRPLPNVIMDVEQLKFSTLLGKNVNNTGPWGNSLAAKKKLNIHLHTYDSVILRLRIYLTWEQWKCMSMYVLVAVLFVKVQNRKQPKFPSIGDW